jgi:hypothetical protein
MRLSSWAPLSNFSEDLGLFPVLLWWWLSSLLVRWWPGPWANCYLKPFSWPASTRPRKVRRPGRGLVYRLSWRPWTWSPLFLNEARLRSKSIEGASRITGVVLGLSLNLKLLSVVKSYGVAFVSFESVREGCVIAWERLVQRRRGRGSLFNAERVGLLERLEGLLLVFRNEMVLLVEAISREGWSLKGHFTLPASAPFYRPEMRKWFKISLNSKQQI